VGCGGRRGPRRSTWARSRSHPGPRRKSLTGQGKRCYIFQASCCGLVVKREETLMPRDPPTPLSHLRHQRTGTRDGAGEARRRRGTGV
jgi:hypothetical protein